VILKNKENSTRFFLLTVFSILSVLIVIAGYYIYHSQASKSKLEVYSHLSYISKLKVDQISSWRNERIIDAHDFQENQSLINDIHLWYLNKNNLSAKSRIQNWIKYVCGNIEINYSRVALINMNLGVELSTDSNKTIEPWGKQSLELAFKSKEIEFSDLHPSSSQKNHILMDLIIPLFYPADKNGKLIGFMFVSVDPEKVLFPLIKTWPSESRSAETLLIRPEGDSVLYLNSLRGRNNKELNYRLPLSMINVPSVQAARGYRGMFEGIDYRGVQVISFITDVPGTNWVVVTKVDLDESLQSLRSTSLLIISVMVIIILIAGISLISIWNRQRSRYYKDKFNLEIESEKALKESESKFRYLAESITDIFFAMDKDLKLTYWNSASEKMSGIPTEDALGKPINEIFPNVKGNKTERIYFDVLKSKTPKTFINEFIEDGKTFAFEVSVYPSLEGVSVFTKDITEHKRVEEAIRESEERYRSLFENMFEGFAFCKMIYENGCPVDFQYIQVNRSFEKMTGLKHVAGKYVTELIPGIRETNPELFQIYDRVTMTGKTERFETYLPSLDLWMVISVYSPANEYFIAIFEDVTERKFAEKTIKASLKEKEVLLRELYHRTKNNMQVISSLMGLKSASIQDEQMIEILEDMKNRIQTIALVHQKLYQSQNLSRVDLKEYITDLVSLLSSSYSAQNDKVAFNLNLENVDVLIDTAVPCGLIINELISNSFKHAFPGDRKGNIFICLTKLEGDFIQLKISDDGIGISSGLDLMNQNSLGMQLFHNIALDQLMGDIKVETNNGLAFTITFQDIAYIERV
jgi:PAS domain S-box-containing protein